MDTHRLPLSDTSGVCYIHGKCEDGSLGTANGYGRGNRLRMVAYNKNNRQEKLN